MNDMLVEFERYGESRFKKMAVSRPGEVAQVHGRVPVYDGACVRRYPTG